MSVSLILFSKVKSQPGGPRPLRFDPSLSERDPNEHVNANAFSLRTVQNVIMLNVQTQYFHSKDAC